MENLIKHPERASQVLEFSGILEPPYAPTDIDGLIEWKNKAYIIIECKYKEKQMSKGQQIAIERMINDFVNPFYKLIYFYLIIYLKSRYEDDHTYSYNHKI